jgi:hypothetical protein
VTERGVHLFDPFNCGVRFYNRSQLGAVFSGYFLVAAPHAVMRPVTILAAMGLLLIGLGTWQIARAWRGARRRGGMDGLLRLGSACVFLAIAGCLPGCGSAVSEHSGPENVAGTNSVGPIEATNTDLNLGLLQWKSVAKGEFHFRNKSPAPVKLRLGAASCSCLKAELQPKGVLAPGEEGCLSVQLDTTGLESAGRTRACVSLITGDGTNALKFCVKGVLEGILFPEAMYIIRPAQRRSGTIPDLRFAVITHSEEDFEITRITYASIADLPQMLTKKRDRLHTELVDTKAPLTAELTKVSISPSGHSPTPQENEMDYVRQVSVPMRLDGPPEGYGGRIIVDYVLDGKALQAQTRVVVVGLDDN